MRYIVLPLLMCLPFNLHSQTEGSIFDTTGYLPLIVSGALEYNLMLAASEGYYTEVERMILKGADPNAESGDGVTPLVYAVINRRLNTVKALLQNDADVNHITERMETPLLTAVKNMDFEIAETLIRYGAEVNYRGNYGAAPLHFASAYGFSDIADLLLYYDAEVDIESNDGTTPLMAAIWAGWSDVARLLIMNGANLEARDAEGFTPFLIAAQNGDTAIMEMLREKGVDIYEKNIHNWDALNLAIRSSQVKSAEMLLRTGDKWNDPGRNVINPRSVAITYREMEMIYLLDRNNFPPEKRIAFDQMAAAVSFKTDFRDFYSGYSISFREPLRNLGIITGFDTKLWYTRVLIKEEENLFYQYPDKSSLVYAGVFKEYALTDNLMRSNYYLTASLSAGYSFGNKLAGTLKTPGNKFRILPAIIFKWTKNSFSLISGLEFTNTEFYKIGPVWFRFGMQQSFFFDNVRAPLKALKWY
jgi:ankyrin repeat protein